MAKLFNMQRVQGVVIVPEGTKLYNNRPVIGVRNVDVSIHFTDNKRVLGVDIVSNSFTVYNETPVVGVVPISDDRLLYNNNLVIPVSGLLGVLANASITGTPMDTLALSVSPGIYTGLPDSYSRQFYVSDDGVAWTPAGAAFTGNTFNIAGYVGKYLMLAETATKDGASIASMSNVLGPVSAFVAMPALPLAVGEKLFAMGDSQIGWNNYNGSAIGGASQGATLAGQGLGYGFIEWARILDKRFQFTVWYDATDPLGRNFVGGGHGLFGDHLGVRGANAPGILPRTPAFIAKMQAAGSRVAVFEGGFNTIHSDDDESKGTADWCIKKLDEGLTLFRKAAIFVYLVVPYDTGAWPVNDKRYGTLAQVQAWCRAQATRDGVKLIDFVDFLSPGGVLDLTMLQSDKIHLSAKAAQYGGKRMVELLDGVIAPGSYVSLDVTDSNLQPATQANMDGATGTMTNGNPASTPPNPNTGSVPTGYEVNRARNCALSNTIDEYATGKRRLNVAVTPGGNDSGAYYELLVRIPRIVTTIGSKWFQAMVFFEADEMQDIAFVEFLYGIYNGASTIVNRGTAGTRNASPDFSLNSKPGPFSGWLLTQPVYNVNGVAADSLNGLVRLSGPKAGSPFTFKLSQPIIREIPDPRAVWGY